MPRKRQNPTAAMRATHMRRSPLRTPRIFFMDESVVGFDALYDSMEKCQKGVTWKDSAAHYVLNGIRETLKLEEQLKTESYRQHDPMHFKITSPKPRDIISVAFRDRVYQRSLNDNAVYPKMTRHFIYDNAACLEDKGTDFARDRMKHFLQEYYRKHGTEGFIAVTDVHAYYPSMRHDVAEGVLRKGLDPESFERCQKVLESQYAGDTGYNPGSQMVQIIGVSMLNGIDHYIKEVLRIHGYIRYMDDSVMIHESKEYLEYCITRIGEMLGDLGLEFNPKKTKIIKVTDEFEFLGFYYRLTKPGKVLMRLDPERVKKERRKLRRMAAKYHKGEMPRETVYQSYAGWREFASRGDNTQLIMRMDAYLKQLMEAEDGTEETQTGTKREKGVRSSQSGRGKAGGPDRVPCPA